MLTILLRVLPLRAARQFRAPMGGLGTDSYTSSKHQGNTDLTPLPLCFFLLYHRSTASLHHFWAPPKAT
jgi:hypothetical protein